MYSLFFKKNDGFSLVETMSGIVILTIALLPALGYFANSVDFVHQTEIRSQAMDIAADTMEYFKMEAKNDWSNINSTADSFTLNNLINLQSKYDDNLFVDNYNIEVFLTDFAVLEKSKKVKVRVLWNGGSKDVELTSLVRDGG